MLNRFDLYMCSEVEKAFKKSCGLKEVDFKKLEKEQREKLETFCNKAGLTIGQFLEYLTEWEKVDCASVKGRG
jgi:hypothetical protein